MNLHRSYHSPLALSATELKTWKAYANQFSDPEVTATSHLACGVTIIPDMFKGMSLWYIHAVDHTGFDVPDAWLDAAEDDGVCQFIKKFSGIEN